MLRQFAERVQRSHANAGSVRSRQQPWQARYVYNSVYNIVCILYVCMCIYVCVCSGADVANKSLDEAGAAASASEADSLLVEVGI